MAAASLANNNSQHARSNSESENGTATVIPGQQELDDTQQVLQHQHARALSSTSLINAPPPPSMKPIEADIILPFADRPAEIKELLESEPKNRALNEQLRDTFCSPSSFPSSSSHKWSFEDLQAHLAKSRQEMPDQDFIDQLKASVAPRSQLLWERLRACLGVDVDDEQGRDKYEEMSRDVVYSEDPTQQPMHGEEMQRTSLHDYLLSPRAVLQQQQQHQQQLQQGSGSLQLPHVGVVAAPSPPPTGSVSPASGFPNIPSGGGGMSISPLSGSGFPGPSTASGSGSGSGVGGGGGGLPTATQEHPNPLSPRAVLASLAGTGLGGSGTGTPSSSGHSSPARNHRRTSSGSSGFRHAMQMSSINEDGPVHEFNDGGSAGGHGRRTSESDGDDAVGAVSGASSYNSSPAMTPSHSGQGLNSLTAGAAGGTGAGAQKVGLGDLLRLRGHPLESPAAATEPVPHQQAQTPAQARLAHQSSGSVGHALGLGPASTAAGMQGSALASSLGSSISSSFGGGGGHMGAAAPGHLPPVSGLGSSSLGLSISGQQPQSQQSQGFSWSYAAGSPARSRHGHANYASGAGSIGGGSRSGSVDDGYTGVFESEDGDGSPRSFGGGVGAGGGNRYRPGGGGGGSGGPGPGVRFSLLSRTVTDKIERLTRAARIQMRHSFSSADAEPMQPKVSGFALAGLQTSSHASAGTAAQNQQNKALNGVKRQENTGSPSSSGSGSGNRGAGDGVSTPRAGSPGQ